MIIKTLKYFFKKLFLPKIAEIKLNKTDFALYIEDKPKYFYINGGNKNPDKLFYVIQRSPGAGLFSNIAFIINHIKIAENLGAIPVLDSFNFPNLYNENIIRNNSWDSYLSNNLNYSLEEVYSSKNILITTNEWAKFFVMSIGSLDNAYNYFFKYFKINENLLQKVNNYITKNHFLNEKIIGLHFRGGDQKTANGHQFPLTKTQIYNKLKDLIKENKYTKIFCSTESIDNLNFVKKHFKEMVIYYDSYRSLNNPYLENYRENHRILLGEEILIEALILSKTDFFLCGNSNVSEFVKIIRSNENKPFLEMKNGKNSNNPFLALYLFKIKSILPYKLGGFKKKL